MKPFFRTAEARGGVCEIAQSLRGGEYSSAGNCTFFYIASAQKNYRLCRYVAEQLQLQGEKRNSVL